MTTATKTKTRKVAELCPPSDVRDNTKARRAWLAETVAANTSATRSAKVIGKGSYETVAVYEHTEVEGRERFRGNCQVCGGAQVVDSGRLVLHGYNRPGFGYIVNRCPGVNEVPLQTSDAITRKAQRDATADLALAATRKDAAAVDYKRALSALYSVDAESREVSIARPSNPSNKRYNRNYKPSSEELSTYRVALAEWTRNCPLAAALYNAENERDMSHSDFHKIEGWLRHLDALLALNLVGTPLQREVVA